MLRNEYPLYLASKPLTPNRDLVVTNKFTGKPAARVAVADRALIDQAIAAAAAAFQQTRRMTGYERRAILEHVVKRVSERAEEFAHALAVEAGKPIRDSRGEITRLIDTFRVAAEESTRSHGEYLALDISPRSAGYEGSWRRFPIGPCSFITPFNFPMNLVAHKVAPAIATGCSWILKPASATPIGALLLGDILSETSLPPGAFSILPCNSDDAAGLIEDERIRLLSFTGSPAVGWALRRRAGRKRVALELGGNAACIVDRGTDLDYAAERITFGAFYQSGQSCISVQRILIQREMYAGLVERLIQRAIALRSGDPLDEATFLGPLISEDEAQRIEAWIGEAVRSGAHLLCGGRRHGAFIEATYLENVDPRQRISCVEAFGPVATLQPFDSFDEALRIANDSQYGLQCGVFTREIDHARRAYDELEVGAVIINDVPAFRVDNMPYGGVKMSGIGREGVRFAMEEMTEIKLLVVRDTQRMPR